jgi:hypothetical protein
VWEEESVEQGATTPTYYPGDKVRLRLEIEHLPNFKEVEAVFLGYSDIEGGLPVRQSMYARGSNIRVLETNADGLKISEVLCEEDVERRTFLPGNVYELAEVIGVTVKDTRVYFDPSDLQGLRFRYADEPTTQIHAAVRHAELLPRVD